MDAVFCFIATFVMSGNISFIPWWGISSRRNVFAAQSVKGSTPITSTEKEAKVAVAGGGGDVLA